MNIVVNGNPHQHQGNGSIAVLLEELSVPPQQIAVVLNDEVISKTMFEQAILQEQDRVELVTFAQGG